MSARRSARRRIGRAQRSARRSAADATRARPVARDRDDGVLPAARGPDAREERAQRSRGKRTGLRVASMSGPYACAAPWRPINPVAPKARIRKVSRRPPPVEQRGAASCAPSARRPQALRGDRYPRAGPSRSAGESTESRSLGSRRPARSMCRVLSRWARRRREQRMTALMADSIAGEGATARPDSETRRTRCREIIARYVAVRDALECAGIPVDIRVDRRNVVGTCLPTLSESPKFSSGRTC